MRHTTDDRYGKDGDFGVNVTNLRPGKVDLLEAPVEAIEARPDEPVVLPPTLKVDMKEIRESFAKPAMTAEIRHKRIGFTFEDESYSIPRAEDWDTDVLESLEEGKLVSGLKALIGADQWQQFKSEPDPDNEGERRPRSRTTKDLEAFFDRAQKALGAKPGESRA